MELLDEIKKKKKNNNHTFSILSLVVGIITVILFLVVLSYVPSKFDAREHLSFPSPPSYLINALRISCILGLILTFLSFINKEGPSLSKKAGAVLNILCFFVVFGSILFAVFVKMNQ